MRNSIVLGSLLWLLSACAVGAGDRSSYTLVQGSSWRGATVDGAAISTLDSICRESICYRFKKLDPVIQARLKRYGLRDGHFDTLAAHPGVERQGNRLTLPYNLGRELYQTAERNYLIHHRRRP